MNSAPGSRPAPLSEREAQAKLKQVGQQHLLRYYSKLSLSQQDNLRRQIAHLDLELLQRQQNYVEPTYPITLEPFEDYYSTKEGSSIIKGAELVKEGKTALIVLAGGQGSRLRCQGPKGCYGVTLVKNKSLFQLLAEKIKAAGKQAGRHLEVAIMTSPLNHVEIQSYFARHAYFGLNPSKLTFFYQRMWPFLNLQGDLFLESQGQIARGPNGNGGIFRRLAELSILEKWKKMGIEYVNIVPIDNPLSDPCDLELFGFHELHGGEVAVKAALRKDAAEKVGVLAKTLGKTRVVEYIDLSSEDKEAVDLEGNLKYNIANLGLYSFSLPFIEKASRKHLPLHRAKKSVHEMDEKGETVFPKEPNAWKYEEFIFDAFEFADSINALLCLREDCFAPLKNLEGEDSMVSVREALLSFDKRVFARVTGKQPPEDAVFELSPQFYYPTEELLEKWKGRELPKEDYIHE